MNDMRWKVMSRENFGWGQLDLRISIKHFNETSSIVLPFTFQTIQPNTFSDALTIPAGTDYDAREFLQACVDHAAELGIFPTNAPSKNELQAIRYHLEDMRKLVFK